MFQDVRARRKAANGPVETIMIDHVEKPTVN